MIARVKDSYKHNLVAFIFGPMLKIIEAIFDLLIPLFMKAVIDLARYGDVASMPEINNISKTLGSFIRSFGLWISDNQMLSDALIGFVIIMSMGIVGFLLTMVTQYVASITAMKVGTELRESLLTKVLGLSRKESERIGRGKLQTVLNSDTYSVQQGVLLYIRLIVRMPVTLIGSLIVSFILDWRIGIVFTMVVPVVLIITLLIMKQSAKKYVGIQEDLDSLSEKTSDEIEGNKVIRAFNKQEYENQSFDKLNSKYKTEAIKVGKINALINPLTFAITSIAIIAVSLIIGNSIIAVGADEGVALATTIIAEIAFLSQIFFALIQFANTFLILTKARVSSKRIDEVLMLENASNGSQKDLAVSDEIISFENVSLKYIEKGNPVLKNISFSLKKGQSLGVIGGTGSGKSSIISLIEKFALPYEGVIKFNGIDVSNIDNETLRSRISLTSQKASIIKGSIKENVLIGKNSGSDEEVIKALKMSEAYEFVSKYDDSIDHICEEEGRNFSGGQRQRISLARGLIKNADLYIFDDCFSALDFITDKKVRSNIQKEYKDASKIFISQRVGTISQCDLILVIESGEIIAQGNHESLLKNCSVYKELYNSQAKETLR